MNIGIVKKTITVIFHDNETEPRVFKGGASLHVTTMDHGVFMIEDISETFYGNFCNCSVISQIEQ